MQYCYLFFTFWKQKHATHILQQLFFCSALCSIIHLEHNFIVTTMWQHPPHPPGHILTLWVRGLFPVWTSQSNATTDILKHVSGVHFAWDSLRHQPNTSVSGLQGMSICPFSAGLLQVTLLPEMALPVTLPLLVGAPVAPYLHQALVSSLKLHDF